MESLTLTEQEIVQATGYRQSCRQLKALQRAGIPADQRPDGSVRVWRHHIAGSGVERREARAPRQRPQLKSDRQAA